MSNTYVRQGAAGVCVLHLVKSFTMILYSFFEIQVQLILLRLEFNEGFRDEGP
jgi:hypothetical protein